MTIRKLRFTLKHRERGRRGGRGRGEGGFGREGGEERRREREGGRGRKEEGLGREEKEGGEGEGGRGRREGGVEGRRSLYILWYHIPQCTGG